jgi:hypothetical protein
MTMAELDEWFWPTPSGNKKIVTSHIYPPIPIRDFDWCAYFDGEEELGGYGYGRTEAEAVSDFIANLAED